jgi:hypothetical protein
LKWQARTTAQSNELLKTSIKFKGDSLRKYENSRNPEQKVRAGLLNEHHIQGLRWDRLVSSLEEFLRGFATFGMIVHVIEYIVHNT